MILPEIAKQFQVEGRLFNIEPLGHGNVNDTYLVIFRTVFSEMKFVLQKINQFVFKQPELVMKNMHTVTRHVHMILENEQEEADRIWQLPRVIPTRDNTDYFIDDDGNYWRAISQIASAHSYEKVRNADHAHEVGAVLGEFHHAIATLSTELLADTLPGFHVTPGYFKLLDEALATKDGQARLNGSKTASNVLKFIEDRRSWASVLEDAKDRGELQMRPVHGDPKTANIMIDDVTGKGTSIIDLDTVKPGLLLYDLGDCLRSCCNPGGEEAKDFNEIFFDTDLCEALLSGYLKYAKDALTDGDKKYMYDAIKLISYELGLRFFADFLAGDKHFKVREPGMNLLRARVQVRLCTSIEARESTIRRILDKLLS